MNKKQIIIVLAVLLLAAGIIYVILSRGGKALRPGGGISTDGETIPSPSVQAGPTTYKPDVPKDAVLTTPKTETPAAPNVKEKLGIYEMQITKNGYDPLTLTVKKGNLVQLRITAVDADYDWAMPYAGLYKQIKKGEVGDVGPWGATLAGTFDFMCRDYCPAGKVIKGSIIVLP